MTPITAPTITLDATTLLSADAEAYSKTLDRKTRLTLATASSTLDIPAVAIATANANAAARRWRFLKDGKSLVLEVSSGKGTLFYVQ